MLCVVCCLLYVVDVARFVCCWLLLVVCAGCWCLVSVFAGVSRLLLCRVFAVAVLLLFDDVKWCLLFAE